MDDFIIIASLILSFGTGGTILLAIGSYIHFRYTMKYDPTPKTQRTQEIFQNQANQKIEEYEKAIITKEIVQKEIQDYNIRKSQRFQIINQFDSHSPRNKINWK